MINWSNINKKNIKSFISGNYNYYKDKLVGSPQHLKEQYYYRLYKCKDDCLLNKRCKMCGCPINKKAFSLEACNKELFPDLLPGKEWREYKEKNNINNIDEIIKQIENDL